MWVCNVSFTRLVLWMCAYPIIKAQGRSDSCGVKSCLPFMEIIFYQVHLACTIKYFLIVAYICISQIIHRPIIAFFLQNEYYDILDWSAGIFNQMLLHEKINHFLFIPCVILTFKLTNILIKPSGVYFITMFKKH